MGDPLAHRAGREEQGTMSKMLSEDNAPHCLGANVQALLKEVLVPFVEHKQIGERQERGDVIVHLTVQRPNPLREGGSALRRVLAMEDERIVALRSRGGHLVRQSKARMHWAIKHVTVKLLQSRKRWTFATVKLLLFAI